MRSRVALSIFLLLLAAGRSSAQQVASPEDVLGYSLGDRFTDAADAVRYAEALAAASDRVRLVRLGTTPEGRPLLLMVIASAANGGRLESVLQATARLTDPELPAAEASAIAASNPAIAWFTYGVHGDESASTEAALWTAWDLATGGEGADGLLDSLVVVIDPVANPDGRDRYVQWYRGARGAAPLAQRPSVSAPSISTIRVTASARCGRRVFPSCSRLTTTQSPVAFSAAPEWTA